MRVWAVQYFGQTSAQFDANVLMSSEFVSELKLCNTRAEYNTSTVQIYLYSCRLKILELILRRRAP